MYFDPFKEEKKSTPEQQELLKRIYVQNWTQLQLNFIAIVIREPINLPIYDIYNILNYLNSLSFTPNDWNPLQLRPSAVVGLAKDESILIKELENFRLRRIKQECCTIQQVTKELELLNTTLSLVKTIQNLQNEHAQINERINHAATIEQELKYVSRKSTNQ